MVNSVNVMKSVDRILVKMLIMFNSVIKCKKTNPDYPGVSSLRYKILLPLQLVFYFVIYCPRTSM